MDKKATPHPKASPYDLNAIATARTKADANRPALKEPKRPYELSVHKVLRAAKEGRNG